MNPNENQVKMKPNDAAAALAMATHISTQLSTPQQPQNAPQSPQTAPGQAQQTPSDPAAMEQNIIGEIDKLRQDIGQLSSTGDSKSEIQKIRLELQGLLTDNENG